MRVNVVRIALSLIATAPVVACAADLTVHVADARGQPTPDAVVTLASPDAPPAAAPRAAPATKIIDQKNETFIPYVEIFRPGDQVVFRNSDNTRHHVYSFSPTRSFEYVLRPTENTSPVALDRAGVVAVGCNIHDQMVTYLYVSDARWIAHPGSDGNARFTDLPAGTYTVQVWHPQLRPDRGEPKQSITLAAGDTGKSATFSLALLPDPRLPFDREKSKY